MMCDCVCVAPWGPYIVSVQKKADRWLLCGWGLLHMLVLTFLGADEYVCVYVYVCALHVFLWPSPALLHTHAYDIVANVREPYLSLALQ